MKIGNINHDPLQQLMGADGVRTEHVQSAGEPRSVQGASLELGKAAGGIIEEKKSLMDEIEEGAGGNAKSKQDMMVLMAHTVSPEAYGRMQEEGFDPRELDPKDSVNIVDEIKATMAKSGKLVAGYNDDLSAEELAAITGSEAYAQELSRAFSEQNVPLDESNVREAAETIALLSGMDALSQGAGDYLIENGLDISPDNLYRAAHSGAAAGHTAGAGYVQSGGYVGRMGAAADTAGMKEQIAGVVERAGEEPDEENMALAQDMLSRGLPLTGESFEKAKELEELKLPMSVAEAADHCARALSDGMHPAQADVTKTESLLDKALRVSDEVQNIPDEAVDALLEKNRPLNLRNLTSVSYSAGISLEISLSARSVTAKRQLEELRLSMTVQVSYKMLKTGVNVDTIELSDLVEQMKAAERELLNSRYHTDDADIASQRSDIFKQAMEAATSLPGLPLSGIGAYVRSSESFSVSLEEYTADGRARALRYEAAGERYESLQTTVRSDLGDSLAKAFSRADSLLGELGIDGSEENLRATRILGYNSMEITQENIERVKDAVQIVDDITKRLTPSATLQMIREGMNPLKMSMDELDRYLEQAPPTGESYAQFLVRMEQKNRVTAEERESYIGIYRMLNTVNKRDGAAVGQLIAQDRELSFENLLQAVRSRRDAGMDVSVDDSLQGMRSAVDGDIEQQIETAIAQDARRDLSVAAELPQELYAELIESNVLPAADHLLGLAGLRERRGELFDLSRRAADIPRRRQHTAADGSVHGSSAGIADDAMELTRSILDASIEDTLGNFNSREEAQEAYSNMADVAERVLSDAAVNDDGAIDLRAISSALKQLGCARQLAREESYEIPMLLDGQQGSVSVSIRHGGEERGSADIRVSLARFGNVHARFVSAGAELAGYFASDSRAGRDAAASLENELRARISGEGLTLGRMDFVYSSSLAVNISARSADEDNESFDTASLYRSAKVFLQVLSEA